MVAPTPSALIGNSVRISFTTRDENGNLINPTNLSVVTKSPSGIITTYTFPTNSQISNPSAGNWNFVFTPNEVGSWIVQDKGSGNFDVAGQIIFDILPGNI